MSGFSCPAALPRPAIAVLVQSPRAPVRLDLRGLLGAGRRRERGLPQTAEAKTAQGIASRRLARLLRRRAGGGEMRRVRGRADGLVRAPSLLSSGLSPRSADPEGRGENGAAETSAEKGAGAFSLSSVTTAAGEVARGENLAEARFARWGLPIWKESESARTGPEARAGGAAGSQLARAGGHVVERHSRVVPYDRKQACRGLVSHRRGRGDPVVSSWLRDTTRMANPGPRKRKTRLSTENARPLTGLWRPLSGRGSPGSEVIDVRRAAAPRTASI